MTTVGDFADGATIFVDPLGDLPGVVASLLMREDGRARHAIGLDPAVANESGHMVASINMFLDTVVGVWSDVASVEASPLRAWMVRSGRYWLAGSAHWAWLLDPDDVDLPSVLRRLDL